MADESGFPSCCPCWAPALGLAVSQQQMSLVSALLQPRSARKMPSHHGTASATTSLCQAGPGQQMEVVMGLHPTLLCSPGGFPAGSVPCHIPLASPSPCLPAEVCPFRWLSQDDHGPELSVQLQGPTWQPLCPSCVQGCVRAHRAERDLGGRVGVLWGSPAPLPTSCAAGRLRDSHPGALQPL